MPAVALIAAVTLCFSSCGGSSDNGVGNKSAQEILQASKEAATSASSVHVVVRSSQGRLTLVTDLQLGSDASRAKVSFLGSDFEVIYVSNTIYVKGNAAYYNSLLGAANVPEGTWLKATPNNTKVAQLTQLTDLRAQLNRILSTPGMVTKGATTTVKGQQVIELKEKTKVYEGALYVATTGKPFPVVLIKTGGREKGRTAFSKWNRPVSVTAPSPVVDIGALKGGA